MDIQEIAKLLGRDSRQIQRLAERGDIPCRKVAGEMRFNRAEVNEWLRLNMPSLSHQHLANMDAAITIQRDAEADEAIITPLLRIEAVEPNLAARTKNSVLKELVALAGETDLLYDAEGLLEAIIQREQLCSTAVEDGIAIPHPRRPMHYAVAEPILVIANTTTGIGFGAPDGRLTDLFFMISCLDDRHHLHVLARLCRMLHDDAFPKQLRRAKTAQQIVDVFLERERHILADSL